MTYSTINVLIILVSIPLKVLYFSNMSLFLIVFTTNRNYHCPYRSICLWPLIKICKAGIYLSRLAFTGRMPLNAKCIIPIAIDAFTQSIKNTRLSSKYLQKLDILLVVIVIINIFLTTAYNLNVY